MPSKGGVQRIISQTSLSLNCILEKEMVQLLQEMQSLLFLRLRSKKPKQRQQKPAHKLLPINQPKKVKISDDKRYEHPTPRARILTETLLTTSNQDFCSGKQTMHLRWYRGCPTSPHSNWTASRKSKTNSKAEWQWL